MAIAAKEYADAIKQAQGLITSAAAKLGCTRGAIYAAIKRHPSVKQAFEDSRERMTDLAEGHLYKKINDGDMTAIIFYLKTQGKSRGYIERQEVDATVKGDITIDLVTLPEPSHERDD